MNRLQPEKYLQESAATLVYCHAALQVGCVCIGLYVKN